MKLIKVGIIGSGLMCKLHSQSYALMPLMFAPSPYVPVKKVLCDVTEELARTGAENFCGKIMWWVWMRCLKEMTLILWIL